MRWSEYSVVCWQFFFRVVLVILEGRICKFKFSDNSAFCGIGKEEHQLVSRSDDGQIASCLKQKSLHEKMLLSRQLKKPAKPEMSASILLFIVGVWEVFWAHLAQLIFSLKRGTELASFIIMYYRNYWQFITGMHWHRRTQLHWKSIPTGPLFC